MWKLHSISLKNGLGRSTFELRNERETDHVYGNFLDSQGGDRCTDHGSGLSEEAPTDEPTGRLDLGQRATEHVGLRAAGASAGQ